MKLISFRQWVACVIVVALLFNVAAPLGLCLCEGCYCEISIKRFLPLSAFTDEKYCCAPPESVSEYGCCGSAKNPCPCRCGDIQTDNTTAPAAVLSGKMPHLSPAGNLVAALPGSFIYTPKGFLPTGDPRTLLPPHVPLHVLLCVFLN